jgi:phenylpyruvate tautomerase PptA (4-oxalocrotonate tautomerase family)
MPMIDVSAVAGTFSDRHQLAQDLAAAVMRWEQVPDLALFRNNTATFAHDLPAEAIANVAAAAAGDAGVAERTWVLLTESSEGGWGVAGHANTGADLAQAARAEMAASARE